MNIVDLVTKGLELKANIKALYAAAKPYEKELEKVEMELLTQLTDQSMSHAKFEIGSVSITESIVPSVKDWSIVHNYLRETNQLYLLERRVSVTGFRDHLKTFGAVPGIEPFTKRAVSITPERNKGEFAIQIHTND